MLMSCNTHCCLQSMHPAESQQGFLAQCARHLSHQSAVQPDGLCQTLVNTPLYNLVLRVGVSCG